MSTKKEFDPSTNSLEEIKRRIETSPEYKAACQQPLPNCSRAAYEKAEKEILGSWLVYGEDGTVTLETLDEID